MKIIETDNQIESMVAQIISQKIKKNISISITNINKKIVEAFKSALINEPEYSSLKFGLLKYHMGLSSEINIDYIVGMISNSVNTKFLDLSSKNKIKIQIYVSLLDSVASILSDPNSLITDSLRGYKLPWLEWLLFMGTQPIIKKYEVELGSFPYSRSGGAIMVRSDSDWSVPSAFAGSQSNNWITRSLSMIENDILQIIQKNIGI